jgi:hypothetical protein
VLEVAQVGDVRRLVHDRIGLHSCDGRSHREPIENVEHQGRGFSERTQPLGSDLANERCR